MIRRSAGRAAPNVALREIVIRPPGAFAHLSLKELFQARGILWAKVRKQVRLQYDDMLLGLFWAVARPLIMVAVLVGLKGVSRSDFGVDIPYALYVYVGLVLWFHFTEDVMGVALSLQKDSSLLNRLYYPRLISPLSYVFGETYNLALAAVPLAIMMFLYKEFPGPLLVLLPVVLAQMLCLTFGVGLIFSSLILLSRDWERLLRFGLYVGLWLSPVIWAPDIIPPKIEFLFHANPMSGTLLAMRATLFRHMEFPWGPWLYSCLISVVLTGFGLLLFQRADREVMDRI